MRDIKFRAWNKEQNIMYHNAQNTYDFGCCSGYGGCPEDHFGVVIQNKDYILMQYTGEKDINGIEIYEDDVKIVREVYKCIKPLEVPLLNEGGILWIKYENTIKYTERELMYNSELHNRVILVSIKGNKYIEIDKKEFKEKFKMAGYTGIIQEFDIKIR